MLVTLDFSIFASDKRRSILKGMKSRWRVDAEFQISRRFHPASNQRCSLWIQKIRWPRYRARVFHAFIVMLSKNTCLYPFNFILLGIGRAEYVLGMIYLLVIWAKALLIKLLVKAFLHLNKSVSQLKFGREEPRGLFLSSLLSLSLYLYILECEFVFFGRCTDEF